MGELGFNWPPSFNLGKKCKQNGKHNPGKAKQARKRARRSRRHNWGR